MQLLVEKIKAEGIYLGKGIVKVDSFMNHQIDPALMMKIGEAFASYFGPYRPTRILTAESSGIPPAMATGAALGLPVVYARKKVPLTMSNKVYAAEAPSRTKGGVTPLMVSPDFLGEDDKVLLIDDFLATGQTAVALIEIIRQSGAQCVGVGCVIEKNFEPGRKHLSAHYDGPIHTLAKISLQDDQISVSA